jgi:hypothetical protein
MATSLVIEDERGTCSGHYHPHNGYYAGDFSVWGTSAATAALGRSFAEGAADAA